MPVTWSFGAAIGTLPPLPSTLTDHMPWLFVAMVSALTATIPVSDWAWCVRSDCVLQGIVRRQQKAPVRCRLGSAARDGYMTFLWVGMDLAKRPAIAMASAPPGQLASSSRRSAA